MLVAKLRQQPLKNLGYLEMIESHLNTARLQFAYINTEGKASLAMQLFEMEVMRINTAM
jgi:hypothetical protein